MYDKNRHYLLINDQWDLDQVHKTIYRIVEDAIKYFDFEAGQPCHPMDDHCGNNMYMGSIGVLWAINYLKEVGAVEIQFDIQPLLEKQLKLNQEEFKKDSPHSDNSSYLFGELPILMLQYKFSQDESICNKIFDSIQKNSTQPTRELMWGTAGTMLVANFMSQWTSEPRWKEVFIFQANRLFEEWEPVADIGYLWSPKLYGGEKKYLGPVHGFAGNIIPLIKGQNHFSKDQFEKICEKTMKTVIKTATVDQKYANWVAVYNEEDTQNIPRLVQHCHGAPGIITALSELPRNKSAQFDEILEKGGELIWSAGPLKKGSNLCHGTGGNGYALLKLYERTQKKLWIERARSFAMHSIVQYELSKKLYGQGRYSLWTGDIGLAIYLWDCIQAQAKFPTIDAF